MHVVGIIAEYNPFHNGHLHHLNQIKALFPDSLIVLVLNGYFLERGEIWRTICRRFCRKSNRNFSTFSCYRFGVWK